jgi:hypothetical protein
MSRTEPHEFEPVMICGHCQGLHEDCKCEDTTPEETDECEVCGRVEGASIHEVDDE